MPAIRLVTLALAALSAAGGPLAGCTQALTASQITPPSFPPARW
ncbi:hypothetical protein [Methylobacterium sp. Leaf123]|nr:hypothetical protein [Methylobacterium sp. Leaf123]